MEVQHLLEKYDDIFGKLKKQRKALEALELQDRLFDPNTEKNAVISPVNLFIGEMNYQLLYKKITPTHLVTVSCFGIMRIQNEPILTDCYSILLLKRRKNALFSQFLPNFRQVEPS